MGNMTFHDIRIGSSSGASDIEAISCPPVSPRACAQGPVATFQVLRASNGEPWGHIDDRDTFDWAGLGVTLGAPGHWSFMNKKYLEIADVEANTTYGPWRDCNWDPVHKVEKCSATTPDLARLVARSSAEQLTGPTNAPGQCGSNDEVGSWLVFPHEGECRDSEDVGQSGCTWKLRGVKVIAMDCIYAKKDAFIKRWEQDWQKAPFPGVIRFVKAAVEACPDARMI